MNYVEATTNKKLIKQLEKLVEAASNEVSKWSHLNDCPSHEQEYQYHRNWCYEKIWDLFWEIAEGITLKADDYSSFGDSEDKMRNYLEALQRVIWILDAIEPDNEETQ